MRCIALRLWAGSVVVGLLGCHAAAVEAQQVQVRPNDPVEVRQGSRWLPATILRAERPGWVRVQLDRLPSPTVVQAKQVRLPRDVQAALAAEAKAEAAAAQAAAQPVADTPLDWPEAPRTWTDSTGVYHCDATLVAIAGREVKLLRTDGHEIVVLLERFSNADQTLLRAVSTLSEPIAVRATANRPLMHEPAWAGQAHHSGGGQ